MASVLSVPDNQSEDKHVESSLVPRLDEGSNPSSHPIFLGRSQVGKARDFDSRIRWFESNHPSQTNVPLARPGGHLENFI